MIAAGTAAEET